MQVREGPQLGLDWESPSREDHGGDGGGTAAQAMGPVPQRHMRAQHEMLPRHSLGGLEAPEAHRAQEHYPEDPRALKVTMTPSPHKLPRGQQSHRG